MSTMKPLRLKMIHQMQLERLAPKTQEAYVAAVAGLAKFHWRSPDQLSPEQIRNYLHHLLVERQLAWSSCNQVACGLKFFYTRTLGWDTLHLNLPPRTRRSQLPHVPSAEELQRLFTSANNPKHRTLLMTTYAAGLRVSEVVHLQVTDIESERVLIRVNQGKGHKDRYPLLSARLLAELRAYWKLERCKPWLFPGQDRDQPMPIASAQRIYYHAKRAANLQHGKGINTLRHNPEYRIMPSSFEKPGGSLVCLQLMSQPSLSQVPTAARRRRYDSADTCSTSPSAPHLRKRPWPSGCGS